MIITSQLPRYMSGFLTSGILICSTITRAFGATHPTSIDAKEVNIYDSVSDGGARISKENAQEEGRAISRPALQIGKHSISYYRVQKYYYRFVNDYHHEHGRQPTVQEIEEWHRMFLAQQVVIAHAKSNGYGERLEVRDAVERMERNMLSQSNGPLYTLLFQEQMRPVPHDYFEKLYQLSLTAFDAVIVVVKDDRVANTILGADFIGLSEEECRCRIEKIREREDVDYFDGPIYWPFAPFPWIADEIEGSPDGVWSLHRKPPFGIYYIFVRSRTLASGRTFDEVRDSLERFDRSVNQRLLELRRARELLVATSFSLNAVAARDLAKQCSTLARGTPHIPLTFENKEIALFCYQDDGRILTVTVGEFIEDFNRLVVRQIPRTLAMVKASAERMVVTEMDVREARKRELDSAPRFAEDRQGFADFQILDLFERECLAPAAHIGSAQIESYYRLHRAEFAQTSKVRGHLLTFASAPEAKKWMSTSREVRKQWEEVAGLETREIVEVSKGIPLQGFEGFHEMIMRKPQGFIAGPVVRTGKVRLFLKEENTETYLIPLTHATEGIRATLLRPAIDKLILKLAQDIAFKEQFPLTQAKADLFAATSSAPVQP